MLPLRSFARACSVALSMLSGCAFADSEDFENDEQEETDDAHLEVGTSCAAPATFTFTSVVDETVAYLDGQPVAWFTTGARTVSMVGPSRTYTWGNPAVVTIQSTMWVRTLSAPFDPNTPASTLTAWLNAARAVNCASGTADILAIAYEYADGGSLDAGYDFGADFHDNLGESWQPPDARLREADPTELSKLDCSGFMRMVWGYRTNFVYEGVPAKVPLSLNPYAGAMPRESHEIYASPPGNIVIPFRVSPEGASSTNGGAPTATELGKLRVGDLVFFDTNCDYSQTNPTCGTDASAIAHIGMYVGRDTAGRYRFISSRSTADGPNIGNTGGYSVLDISSGVTYYPKRFRAARRM